MNRRFAIWAAAIAACAGLVMTAGKTRAGLKTSQPVFISTSGRLANGGLGFAHNTANDIEYISCSISTGASSAWVACSARNSDSVTVSCTSSDPDLVAAARSLSPDTYLVFRWNEDGVCTNITVKHSSTSPPKVL